MNLKPSVSLLNEMQQLSASRNHSHPLNQDPTDVTCGGRFNGQTAFTERIAANFAFMNVRHHVGMGFEHPPMTGHAI